MPSRPFAPGRPHVPHPIIFPAPAGRVRRERSRGKRFPAAVSRRTRPAGGGEDKFLLYPSSFNLNSPPPPSALRLRPVYFWWSFPRINTRRSHATYLACHSHLLSDAVQGRRGPPRGQVLAPAAAKKALHPGPSPKGRGEDRALTPGTIADGPSPKGERGKTSRPGARPSPCWRRCRTGGGAG